VGGGTAEHECEHERGNRKMKRKGRDQERKRGREGREGRRESEVRGEVVGGGEDREREQWQQGKSTGKRA